MDKDTARALHQAELFKQLNTSPDGLSTREAAARLAAQGPNMLAKKTANASRVLLRQLKSSLVYLLVAASVLAYSIRDYSDGTIIFAILLINSALGFYQEYKSEKIVEKLSSFITRQVRLRRNGQMMLCNESDVVPGDLLTVREGDIVPADLRLTESESLLINESQLTGESEPIIKRPEVGAHATMDTLLFTGSVVVKGEGTGVVYATGSGTELGTIARLSTQTKKQTQYEQSLQTLSTLLIRVVLLGLLVVFIAKLWQSGGTSDVSALLLFIIALAVSTVPEVLPVITTVTLSAGALKLAKKHVVVKRLSCLEDLGNVNLLCTDKTGTLTENNMTVHSITADDVRLFQVLAYASTSRLKSKKHRLQNTYDNALEDYITESVRREAKHFALVKELPFDPEDRRSRTIIEDTKEKKFYLVSMGAPDILLKEAQSTHRAIQLRTISEEGLSGLHHLGIAYKVISYDDGFDIVKNEHNLHFLGYMSLIDPLRPSAKGAIEHAHKLGITVKILTGDRKEVAEYVGKQIGLVAADTDVYEGSELEAMSPNEFLTAIRTAHVFARVSPEQKFKIIEELKKEYVVAYQGDGINDAPALKLADVAIAVNSATDIAKENADIVLLNKSLEVIVNGVKYGRSIFVNINKYIRYTMLNNFGMFIALSLLYLFSTDLPILPVQILLTNLFGDLPLVMVSSDTVDDAEVVRPEHHNIRDLIVLSLVLGIPTAIFELLYFWMVRNSALPILQTSLYVFFAFQALIIFYAIRNTGHFWKTKSPPLLLNISFLLAFIVSFSIIYLPIFQRWFSFVPLPLTAVVTIICFVLFYLLATDAVKVWYYEKSNARE